MLRLRDVAVVAGLIYVATRGRAPARGPGPRRDPLTKQEHLTLKWLEQLAMVSRAGQAEWKLLIPRTEEEAEALQALYVSGAVLRRYADGRAAVSKPSVNDGALYKRTPGTGRGGLTRLRSRLKRFGVEA